jgi:hypothetical protein
MIELKQGEGYVFEYTVTDSSAVNGLADLTGAEAWLSMRKLGSAETKHKLCAVEMKIWLNDLPLVLMQAEVKIWDSEMPVKPTVQTL